MSEISSPGEDKAWEILLTLKPEDVCRTASVWYDDATAKYTVTSFGLDFTASLKEKTISSTAQGSEALLGKLGYFFRLSLLWYLVSARDIVCTGRPVKLEHIKGGDIFTRGSHVLPLDMVAAKYGKNKNAFIEKGKTLGGEIGKFGDASLRLRPLPRIPVVLTLWAEDEEFPARADLFFDSTCELQLPTDIIWSIAMMSILVMV
jgi:hypothetical protein